MVTSPQDSVNMVVSKGVKMAQMLKIPVLGIIENFSYFECTSCHEKHALFGPSKTAKIANQFNLEILGEIPIDSAIANAVDEGLVEMIRVPYYDKAIAKIMALLN